jgi:hypothetical protein
MRTVVGASCGRSDAVRTDEVRTAFKTTAHLSTELVNLVTSLADLDLGTVTLAVVPTKTNITRYPEAILFTVTEGGWRHHRTARLDLFYQSVIRRQETGWTKSANRKICTPNFHPQRWQNPLSYEGGFNVGDNADASLHIGDSYFSFLMFNAELSICLLPVRSGSVPAHG